MIALRSYVQCLATSTRSLSVLSDLPGSISRIDEYNRTSPGNRKHPSRSSRTWSLDRVRDGRDVIVIGAGPAGAFAARQLALNGASTLLVDRAPFPRDRVCGCRISACALAVLRDCELEGLPEKLGSVPLSQLLVSTSNNCLHFPLLGSQSLSRSIFDAALVQEAIAGGAEFLPATTAKAHDSFSNQVAVTLQSGACERKLGCRIVVVADGISGLSTASCSGLKPRVDLASRIGVGAISSHAPEFYCAGTIYMAYGPAPLRNWRRGRLCRAVYQRRHLRPPAASVRKVTVSPKQLLPKEFGMQLLPFLPNFLQDSLRATFFKRLTANFAIASGVTNLASISPQKAVSGSRNPQIGSPFGCSTKYSPNGNFLQERRSSDRYRGFSRMLPIRK